jgi:hypothetical protein
MQSAEQLFSQTSTWANNAGWGPRPPDGTEPASPYSKRAEDIVSLIRKGEFGCQRSRVHQLVQLIVDPAVMPLPPLHAGRSKAGAYNPKKGEYYARPAFPGWPDAEDYEDSDDDHETFGEGFAIVVVVAHNFTKHNYKIGEILLLDKDANVQQTTFSRPMMLNGVRGNSSTIALNEVRPATAEECAKVAWRFRDYEDDPLPTDKTAPAQAQA